MTTTFRCPVSEATVFVSAKSLTNKTRFKWTIGIVSAINVIIVAIYLLGK